MLAVVVALGGIGAFQVWKQEQDYQAGHAAYLAADCATAVGPLGSVAKGSAGSSGSDVELKARAELQECEALLDADDLTTQGKQGDAVLAYSDIVTKYPRSPLKDAALARGRDLIATAPDKVATVSLCDALEAFEAQGFVVGQPDPLPPLLFACGGAYEAADAHADAVAIYARFRADYPDHDLAADVDVALARATLAETENAPDLPPPGEGPGTGTEGVATIVIQNDSPDPLSMVFSGPDIRVEDLEACSDCAKVTGAIYECRDPDQSPTAEYKVAPGVYEVVVKSGSGSNVSPFRGTWTLEDGEVYASCFYISSGP